MTEKKKKYLLPRMEVIQVHQAQIICASPGETKSMHEVELSSDSFKEQ